MSDWDFGKVVVPSTRAAPADIAITKMRSPYEMHIICIDVTNRCDLDCSNCTRLLVNQEHHWDMTPENFRTAVRTLADFSGVIAMIGGNPCVSPNFPEYCRIFAEEIPNKRQRGLWSNNILKHEALIAETFGFFNLNPHGEERCIESMERLKKLVPDVQYYVGHSKHAPILAASRDLFADEESMWEAISQCDINKHWSASIVQNKGELRAYFCEVAASFDLARGEDHGHPVVSGWWRKRIQDFAGQVKHFCPGCGVPARLEGRLDSDETDDYTATNEILATITRRKRKTELVRSAVRSNHAVTDYSEQHRVHTDRIPVISFVIPVYNGAATLRETVESVLDQGPEGEFGLEVIISDDGSTDGTRKIAGRLAAKWGNVHVLPTDGNHGPAHARNRGLRAATGDFVVFLDADDKVKADFTHRCLENFAVHPDFAAIVTDIELWNCHREVGEVHRRAMVFSLPSNMMVKKIVADVMGGFPEHSAFRGPTAGEDVAFKSALAANYKVGILQEQLLLYRMRKGSHLDRFLDTTEVVDGNLKFTVVHESEAARNAAAAAYLNDVSVRVNALDAMRFRR